MNKIVIVASALVFMMGAVMVKAVEPQAAAKTTAETTVKKQTVCPVMGGAIDRSIYADANGKRVYFCCNGCPSAFKKDPAKYIAIMEKQGITLDKAPAGDQAKDQKTAAVENPAQGMDHSSKTEGGCCK